MSLKNFIFTVVLLIVLVGGARAQGLGSVKVITSGHGVTENDALNNALVLGSLFPLNNHRAFDSSSPKSASSRKAFCAATGCSLNGLSQSSIRSIISSGRSAL